jgi:hypothetical protein
MAVDEPSTPENLSPRAKRNQRERNRYHERVSQDPDYNKKRYQRWLALHPNGNRDDWIKRAAKRGRKVTPRPLLTPDEKTVRRRQRERKKYLRNKEIKIKSIVSRQKQRYENDYEYMLRIRLRNRIRYALKAGQGKKVRRSHELLGCDSDEFVRHIESLFDKGMSWENKCQWHIDHIIPVSAFDLTTEEGQQAAFHYTNLQPLWAHDNRRKSARLPAGQRHFKFGYVVVADKKRELGAEGRTSTERRRA